MSGSRKVTQFSTDRFKASVLEELEYVDSNFLVASAGEPSHLADPLFTFQLFFGDSLANVQELLYDDAFDFTKGLLLKNKAKLFFFVGSALTEHQLSNFPK